MNQSEDEVANLRLEVKSLENQLNSLHNEKIELEKLLSNFQHRHSVELGQIIIEILELRKVRHKEDKVKFEEAESDYKSYSEQFDQEKARKVFELSKEESNELKKKFRKASFLCHPDKVSDEYKEDANKIFIALKTAYEANDLNEVSRILEDLEKGGYFKSLSEIGLESDILKASILKLKTQIKNIEAEIKEITDSETYQTIISIKDWNVYFESQKSKLIQELEYLIDSLATKT